MSIDGSVHFDPDDPGDRPGTASTEFPTPHPPVSAPTTDAERMARIEATDQPAPIEGSEPASEIPDVARMTAGEPSTHAGADGIDTRSVPGDSGDQRVPEPAGPGRPSEDRSLPTASDSTSAAGENAVPPEELPTLDGAAPTDLAQRRLDATAAVCADHGLEDPEAIEAVALAHQLVCDNHAPFIVDRTLDMLDHIKADVEAHPGTVVVFLGRDGDAIGLAARELDPEFYEQHCTHVTLSRCLAESAVQDLEKNANKTFPELKEEEFRNARSEVNPEHVDGARARLTEYLELRGVPVGEPGARIILVDTSFKGTVQNLLTATYPGADFHGKYLFYDQSSTDPNAGQKTAFALHRDPEGTITDPRAEANQPGGTGANPLEIFVEKDPVLAIEQILRGSLSKAVHVENGVPDQHPESPPLEEINPLEVAEKYLDEPVRLAVMDINQLAVADFAATVAVARREGGPWRADLDAKAKEFVNKLGAWSRREPLTEPALAEFLGSFVRREDKRLVAQLHSLIEDRGLDSTAVWRDYQQCGTLAAQSAFVEEKRNDTTASGGEASYG